MTTSTPKSRSSRACNYCFTKKIRCDGHEPCTHCQEGSLVCTYRPQKKRGPPKGCQPRGGIKVRKKASPDSIKPDDGDIIPVNVNNVSVSSASSSSSWPLTGLTVADLAAHQTLNGLSPTQTSSSTSAPSLFGMTNVPIVATGPVVEDNDLSQVLQALPEALVNNLVDIYLAFVHPHWPIIYLPMLRSVQDLQTTKPVVFAAVLSVAAATFDQSVDQGFRDAVGPNFSSLQMSSDLADCVLKQIMKSNLTPQVDTIQALILVTLVHLGFGRSSQAYQYGGVACRMALDLGLHEAENERQAAFRSTTQETLRVIWACYILDKILSTVLERPMMLRREDLDVAFPDTMEMDEFNLWLSGPAKRFVVDAAYPHMEHAKVHCLSSFQAWAQVMSILEQVLRNVYSRRAKMERKHGDDRRYDEALSLLSNELQIWRDSLPLHLQWGKDHSGVGPHLLTLRAWYYTCLLLLNRPRVPRLDGRRGSNGHAIQQTSGAEVCSASSTEICRLMETYENTFRTRKIPSSWVYLIFQAGTIHSSFSASSIDSVEHLLSPARQESKRRTKQCIHWLSQIAKTWTSASHHVDTLRGLEHVSSVTRPPTPPTMGMPRLLEYALASVPTTNHEGSQLWQTFWNEMPASSEDANLWESFNLHFAQ